jgi:hypothetical protein
VETGFPFENTMKSKKLARFQFAVKLAVRQPHQMAALALDREHRTRLRVRCQELTP